MRGIPFLFHPLFLLTGLLPTFFEPTVATVPVCCLSELNSSLATYLESNTVIQQDLTAIVEVVVVATKIWCWTSVIACVLLPAAVTVAGWWVPRSPASDWFPVGIVVVLQRVELQVLGVDDATQ